jgi:hypothetical protein
MPTDREMMSADDYRRHARECRYLATLMVVPERREQLHSMANVWDRLADDRERDELCTAAHHAP